MSRPKLDLEWDKLEAICQFKASLSDCSEILGVSEDTVQNRIKEKYSITFTEYRKRKMSKVRQKLAMKQYETAMNGNVSMLIWLGKNWLGQSDNPDTEVEAADLPKIEIKKYVESID